MSSAPSSQQKRTNKNYAVGERYLTFNAGREQYAIPIFRVREVIELIEITDVPNLPNYFKGIINLRGQIISVMDLRLKLKIQKIENGAKTAIIILDLGEGLHFGMIVDRITSVLPIATEDISAPPEISRKGESHHLLGIAKRDERNVLLLDLDSVLDFADLQRVQKNIA